MKAHLLYRDRDFDLQQKLPANEPALTQDLELNTLFRAMAGGDEFLFHVAKRTVLSGLENDLATILYRQAILKDCLRNEAAVREIYDIAVEAIETKRTHWLGVFSRYPSGILYEAVKLLQMLMGVLAKLKRVADEAGRARSPLSAVNAEGQTSISERRARSDAPYQFESEGFKTFFEMLKAELADDYFAAVEAQLKELEFKDGVLVSAELGEGNQGVNYVLRKSLRPRPGWFQRIFLRNSSAYTFHIDPRDDGGFRALSELQDRGINLAANAVAQAADHITSFFVMLRTELAFYIGCLNLQHQLAWKGMPVCFPVPVPSGTRKQTCVGLRDACLALVCGRDASAREKKTVPSGLPIGTGDAASPLPSATRASQPPVVGNDLAADGKNLIIITGANQGGKSTFLRGVGLAQLMMQCGMFVAADSFSADLCRSLFTHYKREEDATMTSGKFDEELARMSGIADALTSTLRSATEDGSDSLLLFNESFAATNEREGSEIARQIVRALLETRVKIFFVTHLYEFARTFWEDKMDSAVFLRAERQADGQRTFKLLPGEPLETSFGADLYQEVFESGNERKVLTP
ncbi:MAG: MutS-related protein [Limisphaerales bacterium]